MNSRKAEKELRENMFLVESFITICIREEKFQIGYSKFSYITSPIDALSQLNSPTRVDQEVAEENYREVVNSFKFYIIY